MAHAGSWQSIQTHGLLSTSALLDLFEYQGEERRVIECAHRPESITITHPQHGKAVIRDQKPLREEWLTKTLCGTDAKGWYKLLNSRVFFWATKERLEGMLKPYRGLPQLILIVDTSRLVAGHKKEIELCHMNSGATHANPAPRCPNVFKPIAEYLRREVAEVTVPKRVDDIPSRLISVEAWKG